jgi:hypothetical protein
VAASAAGTRKERIEKRIMEDGSAVTECSNNTEETVSLYTRQLKHSSGLSIRRLGKLNLQLNFAEKLVRGL